MGELKNLICEAYIHALVKYVSREQRSGMESLLEEVKKDAEEYIAVRGYPIRGKGKSFFMVCCNCKRVRDGSGVWCSIEDFLSDRSNVELSHGLCAECARTVSRTLFPDEPSEKPFE